MIRQLFGFAALALCLGAPTSYAQTSPTTINANAITFARGANSAGAANITSTNAQTIPGYSTTNPSQSYFGAGVGNPLIPGIAAVTACSSATDPGCQGVNLLSNGAQNHTTWPINPLTDPTITTGNNVISNPINGLGTNYNGTFLNQQTVKTCSTGSTPAQAQYATFTCTEQLVFGNQTCSPFQNVVVVPTFHYTCVGAPNTLNTYGCSNALAVNVTQTIGCSIQSVTATPNQRVTTVSASCDSANLAVLTIAVNPSAYCQLYSNGWCNATYNPLNIILQPGSPTSGNFTFAVNYTGGQFGAVTWSYDGVNTVTILEPTPDFFSVTGGFTGYWFLAYPPCPPGDTSVPGVADLRGLNVRPYCRNPGTNVTGQTITCPSSAYTLAAGTPGNPPVAPVCGVGRFQSPPIQNGNTYTCGPIGGFILPPFCMVSEPGGMAVTVIGGTTITYTTTDTWNNGCATYQANL